MNTDQMFDVPVQDTAGGTQRPRMQMGWSCIT